MAAQIVVTTTAKSAVLNFSSASAPVTVTSRRRIAVQLIVTGVL